VYVINSELYHRDYRVWANRKIDTLSVRSFADLDITNLLEELRDTRRSERNELKNHLVVLLATSWRSNFITIGFPIAGRNSKATVGARRSSNSGIDSAEKGDDKQGQVSLFVF
jgi:hypothetical protein